MVIAAILAGGSGQRMGANILPKQFLELQDKPVLIHTVEKFIVCPRIDHVIVGVNAEYLQYARELLARYITEPNAVDVCIGGSDRNGTIINILQYAIKEYGASAEDILVTHDSVRPFVSLRIIEENVAAAERCGACDTAIPASDTIIRTEDGSLIADIPLRKEMYLGQTPQSFRIGLLQEVYGLMTEEELAVVTDACKMFFLKKRPVAIVEGEVSNFKITWPFDYRVAMAMVGELT